MENDDEAIRLDIKTNEAIVRKQALWAGIKPGMRVADICFGSGKTTAILYKLVQPGGSVIGIDGSTNRIDYAKEHYGTEGIEFKYKNILEPIDEFGQFDFVWVRFVFEYYRAEGFQIAKNISKLVKQGGILCLIDLDHNSLNHFGLSERLEKTIIASMKIMEKDLNFDPYAGRKLFSFLYDLGYQNIDVDVAAHHLIFGKLKEKDAFNWKKKIEVISQKIDFAFEDYRNGYEEFVDEFERFFTDPRRFTYTPVILCRGTKPFK